MDFLCSKSQLGLALKYWRVVKKDFSVCRSLSVQNHYEILGLDESCSKHDIRNAYLEKIKMLHPDKNLHNPSAHKTVIAVNEAYSILSKDLSRQMYNNQLTSNRRSYYNVETNAPYDRVIFRDDTLWEHRDRSKDKYYEEKPYYGIKGVKRMPNSYIALGAVTFMIIGAIIQYFILKATVTASLKRLNERSEIAHQNYMLHQKQGHMHLIRILKDRQEAKERKTT